MKPENVSELGFLIVSYHSDQLVQHGVGPLGQQGVAAVLKDDALCFQQHPGQPGR